MVLRYNLAKIYVEQRKYRPSIDVLLNGIAISQHVVSQVESSEFRQQVIAGSLSLYELYALILSHFDDPNNHLHLLSRTERVRARNLYSWLLADHFLESASISPDLANQGWDALQQLQAVEVELEVRHLNGSSPKYSKFRPFIGARLMLTPGASRKCTPLARESRPSSVPTSSASAGFHVAVRVTPPANAVAGPKLRTPTGPSAIFNRGQLRRGTSRMKKPSTPPSRSIFSSSVIWLRMESTRRSISADDLREGAGACPTQLTPWGKTRRRQRSNRIFA